MINARELQDIFLQTQSRFNRNMDAFQREFYKPVIETWKASVWNGMDNGLKGRIRSTSPDLARRLDNRFGGEINDNRK